MLNSRFFAVAFFIISSAAFAQPTEGGRRHGPPPESLAACAGLSDGAACGFTHHGNNLTGTCRTGPNKEAPACVPAGGPGGHRGPPPQAIEACKGSSAGAACSVTFGDKSRAGTCATGPSNELVCRPAEGDGHGPHHRGPPPEAIEACKSLTKGAVCSVTLRGETLAGTCNESPGGAVACKPSR